MSLSNESIFGTPLVHPSQFEPKFYDSRLLRVATCLMMDSVVSLLDTLASLDYHNALNSFPSTLLVDSSYPREYKHSKSYSFR